MEIKYRIPYVTDPELNYSDRIMLGFIILLSDYGKNKENLFLSAEIIDAMEIPLNSIKTVLKRLETLGLIKNRIIQNYIYKKRFIDLTEKTVKLCEGLNNTIKTRKERKKSKNGTEIPPTDLKSILEDSDYILGVFKNILDDLKNKDSVFGMIDGEKSCNQMISYFLKKNKEINKENLNGEIRSWIFNAKTKLIEEKNKDLEQAKEYETDKKPAKKVKDILDQFD